MDREKQGGISALSLCQRASSVYLKLFKDLLSAANIRRYGHEAAGGNCQNHGNVLISVRELRNRAKIDKRDGKLSTSSS